MRTKHVLLATVIGGALLFGGSTLATSSTVATVPAVSTRAVVISRLGAPEAAPLVAPSITPTTAAPAPVVTVAPIVPVVVAPVAPGVTSAPVKAVVHTAPVAKVAAPATATVSPESGWGKPHVYGPNPTAGPGYNGQPCPTCSTSSGGNLYLNPFNGSCVTTDAATAAGTGLILDPTCKMAS